MPVRKKGVGKSKPLAQGSAGIEGDILSPFTPSLPLIDGESEADYVSFREGCLRALKPMDTLEAVW